MILQRDDYSFDPNFPFRAVSFRLDKDESRKDQYHWHDFCEVTYIRRGAGIYFVNGRKYEVSEGDVVIFNNTEAHSWSVYSSVMDVSVLTFPLDFIPGLNDDFLDLFIKRGSNFRNRIGHEEQYASEIGSIVEMIRKEFEQEKSGFRLMITGDMLRLLTYLLRHYHCFPEQSYDKRPLVEKKASMNRIEMSLRYIQRHYTEKISLKAVADEVFMSESYFCSCFKKATNRSFITYVSELRVKKAEAMIAGQAGSKSEIAHACGFNNMSNFYKMMKKYGSSIAPPACSFSLKNNDHDEKEVL